VERRAGLSKRGSITDPSALGPYDEVEMRLVGEFKVDGPFKGSIGEQRGPACPRPRGSQS
jgi:hypothetical protein